MNAKGLKDRRRQKHNETETEEDRNIMKQRQKRTET